MSSVDRPERFSSERWERVQALFHGAADLAAGEQRAFLIAACGNDEQLIEHVSALLAEDARSDSLLDRGIGYIAEQTIGQRFVPWALPSEFGPYTIREKLGEGGMGVVYLAERTDVGSVVAIKFLRDAWLSRVRRERFASEQRTLAQLNHPSIARLYDADTLADGTPLFVMEYVEGVPIAEFCKRHACSVKERLHLFRSVCEAVRYAHQHAIIHRDLKPSNILVKVDGSVRLLDFGVAKQLETLDAGLDQTIAGARLLTPAYAAPEHILGERVGVHTDVYSLGVILYELLAGQQLFDLTNLTAREVERAILEREPAKPSTVAARAAELGEGAWADLDAMCLAATHRDVQRRYGSVEALIRDIDHFLGGEALDARPDTLGYRVGKFVGRNRRAVSAAGVALATIVGLVGFFTARIAQARDAAIEEAGRTARSQRFIMNLFAGGDDAVGPADDLRVATLIDRGVQEASALDGEPAMQAELFATLGTIYRKLGKLDRASELLHRALDERREFFGADHREVGESLVALSFLRGDQAQYEEAERYARDGLAMLRRNLGARHPAVAKATFALGKVLEDRGQYAEATEVLEEAARIQSAGEGSIADLVASLAELANTHFYAGHFDTSDALNRRVLSMHRQIYGERHALVADTLINLGAIQFEQGRYAEAERFQQDALQITQAWYGADHPATASALTLLAGTLVYQERHEEAAALLEPALEIAQRTYGPDHPRVASVLHRLGKLALERGNLDAAEAHFRRASSIHQKAHGDKHFVIAAALSNLGSVYAEKQQHARSEQLFREAIERYTEALCADHASTGIARIKLGRALLRQQRYAEAAIESGAGYEILKKQPNAAASWLAMARADLEEAHAALGQP